MQFPFTAPLPLCLLGLVLLSCGKETEDIKPSAAKAPAYPAYPLDDVLRVNHVQMKGTHNSYHIAADGAPDEWNYTHLPLRKQLGEQGVRQFEIDVHYVSDGDYFRVYHLPGDDLSTCDRFVDCLQELKEWSDENPGHHPIVVLIEPKDDLSGYADKILGHYDQLDREVLSVWPASRLITPDLLKGDASTLRESVVVNGWPTLGESRGKAIFVLLDTDREPKGHHYEYTYGLKNLDGRVMFVYADADDSYAAVLDFGIFDTEAIEAAVAENFLVRTRANDEIVDGVPQSTEKQTAALSTAAHMLSTDYPVPGIIDGYGLEITGGTPSRCNPFTAPKACTPDAIESPDRLHD